MAIPTPIVFRPMGAMRVLDCVLALLLLLPPPQLVLLSRLLLLRMGDAGSGVRALYARGASAARNQDGADRRVITAFPQAANSISDFAMLSMSHLIYRAYEKKADSFVRLVAKRLLD